MTTKYSIGDEVYIKAKVRSIDIDGCEEKPETSYYVITTDHGPHGCMGQIVLKLNEDELLTAKDINKLLEARLEK